MTKRSEFAGNSGASHGGAPAKEVPLLRNRSFQLLWSGSVFSALGREMADLVYPLLILALTGSPAWAGAFSGMQMFTSLIVGMPVGELADRFDRRRLLLVAGACRFAATGSVVLALAADALTLTHLLVVAVAVGAVEPLGGAARMVLIRSIVPPSQLTAALTQDEARTHGAALSGPPLGGALYAIGSLVPVLTTAVCQALSLLSVVLVRPPRSALRTSPRADEGDPVLRRMLLGLRVLWRVSTLRHATLIATMLNLVGAPMALMVVVLLRDRDTAPGQIGVVITAMAVGGLVGSALVQPLQRMLPPGVLMLSSGAGTALALALLPMPLGTWWAAVPLFLLGLIGPSVRILVDVLIFRQVPDGQRGRVIAAFMTILGIGSSAGLFGAGLLLAWLSAAHAPLVLAALLMVSMGPALGSRVLRTAQWPQDPESTASS